MVWSFLGARVGSSLGPFLAPFWAHFGLHFWLHLEPFWAPFLLHFGLIFGDFLENLDFRLPSRPQTPSDLVFVLGANKSFRKSH